MSGALDIRVIDLTRMAPGPFCTMILGDLGADVVRVEEPGGGRLARAGAATKDEADSNLERSRAALNALGRNKRSIMLNLKSPEAREVLNRLCEDADVFVEGFRPGVVKRLGCDYEAVSEINPRIVYCSISGYGQDGPYRDLVGHDINYIGIGGALGITGTEDGRPVIPYNIIADYAAGGMQAVIGIMAALMAREKTGRGQYVDISMTDGIAYMLAAAASEYFRTDETPRPGAMALNGGVPYYNVYQCGDGKYISIGCIEPWFWENLCRAVGKEEFISHQHDKQRHPEMFESFQSIFSARTRDEWWEHLRNSGDVAVGKVNSLDEVFQDPQILHRRMLEEVKQADGKQVRQVGIGPKLSETPGKIRTHAPVAGQHTDEILGELGYAEGEIEAIHRSGALGQ